MTKVPEERHASMGRRVLVFSSIGHALMHMMTAFYAVIVLTLAVSWDLPAERLLELYAPATVLLGVMSLPAGWASDRFGAPPMMVVMFLGLGLSSIACGLVATGDTFALMLALCGLGVFGAIYHSVGIGWIIRTAREQGHAMGVNGLWGSAGLALYGVVPGVLITLASWRAAFIVPGIVCILVGIVLAWQIRQGRVGDRPMPASAGVQAGKREF
jgi:MFS transporter, FSR family, fosmidomycin resistance protein